MPAGSLSLGGIQYEIFAVDRTKEATESAKAGVDSVGVHYSDTLSNIAFNYNMLMMAAQTAYSSLQQGWNETIGAAERYQEQMDDMHNQFGISIEDAQRWRAATTATDTDMASLSYTMRYLSQRITDSSEAGAKLRKSLLDLGVDARDSNGNWKDTSTLMLEVLAALNKLPEGAERANAAQEILGRGWYRMADMISNSDVALEEFNRDNKDMMTEEELDKIERFKIKWAQLADKIELAKANLGLWIVESAEAHDAMNTDSTVLDRLLAKQGLAAFVPGSYKDPGGPLGGAGGRGGKAPIGGGAAGPSLAGTFKDPYEGMTETGILYRELNKQLEEYQKKMAADTTQEQFEADALAAHKLKVQIDQLNEAKQKELEASQKEHAKQMTDAYKEYADELQKVADLKKRMYEDDRSYGEDVAFAGRDVARIRQLTMAHNQKDRAATSAIAEAEARAGEKYNQYEAVKSGDLIINIDGQQVAKIPSVISNRNNISPADTKVKGVVNTA